MIRPIFDLQYTDLHFSQLLSQFSLTPPCELFEKATPKAIPWTYLKNTYACGSLKSKDQSVTVT